MSIAANAQERFSSSVGAACFSTVHGKPLSASHSHCHDEPALPRTAAVSETSRSNVRTPSVHGKLQRSRNAHCDHEPPSPSDAFPRSGLGPGTQRPFGIWLLELPRGLG